MHLFALFIMPVVADILGDPTVLLDLSFDPCHYSVLGITLGASQDILAHWEFSEPGNRYGWHFLSGGVRVRVADGVVTEIALPSNFLSRLTIHTVSGLLSRFGSPDATEEIVYKGRVTRRAYVWQRGFLVWCDVLAESVDYMVLFDPARPCPTHSPEGV